MVRFASLCHVNHDSTAVQIFPSSSPTGKISQPRDDSIFTIETYANTPD